MDNKTSYMYQKIYRILANELQDRGIFRTYQEIAKFLNNSLHLAKEGRVYTVKLGCLKEQFSTNTKNVAPHILPFIDALAVKCEKTATDYINERVS